LAHDLETIRKLGVKWLRTEFDWRKIEPRQGQMSLQWFDALVELCAAKQINLVPVLVYSPKWAAPRFNFPPDPEHFSRFVGALVKRYCNYIKEWEIWNEANSYFFWVGDAKQYATLLTMASRAAKQADPSCKILMCGLADPANPSFTFLFDVLRYSEASCVDILNLHAYPGTWNSRRVEEWPHTLRVLSKELQEIGKSKPIWITETGLASPRKSSEKEDFGQSSYLVRAFASLLASEVVEKVFWYRLKDEKPSRQLGYQDDEREERFGLLNQSSLACGSRTAYRAYSRLSKTLPPRLGGVAGSFFVDRQKPAFNACATIVRTLGHEFETGASRFEGASASVSFQTPSNTIRISWNDDGYPDVSVSASRDPSNARSGFGAGNHNERTTPLVSKRNVVNKG
jgi:hypothetical protein